MSRGFTLIEALMVLALLATAVATVAPAARRYRDVSSVVAARESLVGLVAGARLAAVGAGGATLRIRRSPPTAWIETAAGAGSVLGLEEEHGVALDLGGRDELALSFDALGIGRVASATIRFSRGDADKVLIVSSYGRVRRP